MDNMIPMGQQMAVPKTSQTEMMISRQAQEVQGAIVMAKKFPRDEYDAMERIKRTCQRATLAEQAIYIFLSKRWTDGYGTIYKACRSACSELG